MLYNFLSILSILRKFHPFVPKDCTVPEMSMPVAYKNFSELWYIVGRRSDLSRIELITRGDVNSEFIGGCFTRDPF